MLRDLILITRPDVEAEAYKQELKQAGFSSVISPMLKIVPVDFQVPDLSPYMALIFTSAQAITAFAASTKIRNLPVYTVGQASAEHARSFGFFNVIAAAGDGADLARLIGDRHRGEAARFLHVRGEDVAFDLDEALSSQGFRIDPLIVYRAALAESFTPEALAALQNGQIKAAVFFSRRTAQNFINLIAQENLGTALTGIKALCISQSVLECVQPKHGLNRWLAVYVSSSPDRSGLLKLLRAL